MGEVDECGATPWPPIAVRSTRVAFEEVRVVNGATIRNAKTRVAQLNDVQSSATLNVIKFVLMMGQFL